MNYSLTIREPDFEAVRNEVFSLVGVEGGAYLLCGQSRSEDELRLLVHEVIPIRTDHYIERQPDFLSISSASYAPLAKRANQEQMSIVFVHSHPGGYLEFSHQDDREEKKLQEFFVARASNNVHGALILTETGVIGRVYDGGFVPLSRIRIIGKRFLFHDYARRGNENIHYFDRQIRAFGPEIQSLLNSLHIGIVGAGGTGSAVVEQLARLGVGSLSIFDGDVLDVTNVNRVYGSGIPDSGDFKVAIAKSNVERIGLGTKIRTFPGSIAKESIAKHLRCCDIIFSCTDKQAPRSILLQVCLRYLIPVIDMGVVITSHQSVITDVIGRITTLFPGEACLFCRQRISAMGVRLESLTETERKQLAKEGYVPELEGPNPAVVPFTSTIASLAVSELLHRLTGFMGKDRESTEVLCFFDQTRLRTNRPHPNKDCLCSQKGIWGLGDSTPFLDTSWAT
jgi:molybdopterin/thiamine biosynthesis adenylyltransferase